MPNIKVIYWNIENFGGGLNGRRGNYVPLCNFIAQVVRNVDADILCIMELKHTAIWPYLVQLYLALLNVYNIGGIQTCDWYCDCVPGAIAYDVFGLPYSPNNVGFTGIGRNEGYAVFWKQNIDKFIMQRADPINLANANPPGFALPGMPPNSVPNTQSRGVIARAAPHIGGVSILPADITIPAAAGQYILPLGTTVAAPGIMRGALVIVGAGITGAAIPLNAGDIISMMTIIGANGVQLNAPVLGVNPIVIPGNYTLTTNLTLPPANSVIVPQHVLSLVLSGRQIIAGNIVNYNPGGVNNWELLSFPSTVGALLWNGSRRPAYCTIKTNTLPPPANQLIPITFYHAPLANPPQAMIRCAISQPLYEAYDHTAIPGAYVHNARAIVGGDLNARLDPAALHYQYYTNNFNFGAAGGVNGGAGCNNAGNPNIRVNSAAPAVIPVFPPLVGPALTVADNPENKSSVQLLHPVIAGNPVISNNIDHYRRLAIDNIFYRGFLPGQAPRHTFRATPLGGVQQQFQADLYDLVRAVSQTIPPGAVAAPIGAPPDNFFIPAATIQAFAGLPVFGLLAMLAAPPIGLNGVLNPAQLVADIGAGVFQTPPGGDPPLPVGGGPYGGPLPLPAVITPQRRAAEFIKLFVSDHLPVIFEMNL